MHLEIMSKQKVFIAAAELEIDFMKYETIHTENSYKFSDDSLRALLRDSDFHIERAWKDRHDWYAITLSRPDGFKVQV